MALTARALPLLLVAAGLTGCIFSPPAPVESSPASGTRESPSPPASPGPSLDRTSFTADYAAATLNLYLAALGEKNVAGICALNSVSAPNSPQHQTATECFSNYEFDIRNQTDYWEPGQLKKWAGMSAVPGNAVVNELDNFVFDSNEGGFKYTAGKPADCEETSLDNGCWFVVLLDEGRAYVSRGHEEIRYE